MAGSDSISVLSAGLGAVLVAACSLPSITALGRRISIRSHAAAVENEKLYEDEDGKATEESQKQMNVYMPKLVGLLVTVVGVLVSIAYAILVTVPFLEGGRLPFSWLAVGSWLLVLLQSISIFVERKHIHRFGLALLAALSCLLVGANLFIEHQVGIIRHAAVPITLGALAWAQAGLLIVALLAFLLIQRRPEVFIDGKPVDGQFTTSVLSKLTFSWSASTLQYARRHQNLDLEDLPRPSAYQRAQVMEAAFEMQDNGSKLWKSLARMFWWPFAKQVIFTSCLSITQFGPQFSMFKLLELLERRGNGEDITRQAWAWASALGGFMVLSTILESWLFFIVWSDIGMPIRSLLSILVFSKGTRRKDVKGAQRTKEQVLLAAQVANAQQTDKKADNVAAQKAGKKDGTVETEDEDSVTKSRQATVNLIGVDAKRISDLCSFIYLYPGVLIKFTVSMLFLLKLIGWRSLLAGVGTFACTVPFNVIFSRWYNQAQGKLMSVRDIKLAVINEALQGIRQIKFSAIEDQWEKKIAEKREAELETQWSVFKYDTGLVTVWIFGPVMLAAVCLSVYTLLNGVLAPSVAFTTIAILAQIEMTLAVIPELTAEALDSWVACNRIEKYLRAPEVVPISIPGRTIKFENATVAWPADDQEEDPGRFALKELSIEFPPKELSVISGRTGSGKSLLLAAILGEVDKLKGTIYAPQAPPMKDRFDHKATRGNWIIDSSVAFVAQIPWIENATIKDNILFGLPFDQGRYRKVLQICALEKDLDMLPDGDMTDIGANGINLSGGQRWRVSFARAMYSRAGILVLDDIFSAVDAHVGRQLFDDALTGELGVGRTRILVTHHVGLCLPKTKYSVHLANGTVNHAGFVDDLKLRGELDDILKEEAEANGGDDDEGADGGEANSHLQAAANGEGTTLTRVTSRRSARSAKLDDGEIDTRGKTNPKKFVEDEKRETGGIKIGVYWQYILAGGGLLIWTPLILIHATGAFGALARSYWVTLWTRSYETESGESIGLHYQALSQIPIGNVTSLNAASDASSSNHNVWFWLGIYVALSVLTWVAGTLKYFTGFVASIKASRRLFNEMNHSILRAPLRWLDTIPTGRILNRFSSDFNTLDSRLAGNMGYFFYQALEAFAITVAGFIASAVMIPAAVTLTILSFAIMRVYLGGAREVKRLESNARSPIFSDFGALLSGVATVRAFDKTSTYINRMYDRIDSHGTSYYHVWLFNRWMGFRLSITGTLFSVAVAVLVVANGRIDAALAGFALNFSLRYTSAITWAMRGYSNIEMDLNSAERIIEYSRIETEDQSGNSPPAAWPTSGRLEVDGLVAGYAPDLPAVLKGLTFVVESGQRVGVVGRTGAGKSSLTLALFRFINQREGTVYIDGLDVSKIKLQDLRSRLAIIPQDPVLFSGTIRSNLDPFNQHSDAELRAAMQRVHLVSEADTVGPASLAETGTTAVGHESEDSAAPSTSAEADEFATAEDKNIFSSLSSKISEGGLNLSQGQRQLLCLARAIVSRPKLMVLDEATSAVDMSTDELIQRSIREEFTGSTLLVIAHRLSTIADFDKILVMSEGKAVEFDSPANLMKINEGVFRGMVENSGEHERLAAMIVAGAN